MNYGRIVIAKEIRQQLDLHERDAISLWVKDGHIILKKVEKQCTFCGKHDDTVMFKEKLLCKRCIESIKEIE